MMSEYTVASHFEGKELIVTAIYTRLLDALRQLGEVHESPKKTSIHLDRRTGFAGVYTRKNYIVLHFRTAAKIDSPRFEKIEQLSANRFMHQIKLQSPENIDNELMDWLQSAYDISG